jgi:hypothetical protein
MITNFKIFESDSFSSGFKRGDQVRIKKEKGKKFKVEYVSYDRVYLLDERGDKCGWIYGKEIEHVPEYEIDAEKYNI